MQGFMGKIGENMGSNNVNITKCEDWQYVIKETNQNLEQGKVKTMGYNCRKDKLPGAWQAHIL